MVGGGEFPYPCLPLPQLPHPAHAHYSLNVRRLSPASPSCPCRRRCRANTVSHKQAVNTTSPST
ncbi:hypothetical protein E2C01_077529 [Portunus trituberculatus]|uniref:Uncharacterized protein n=1 Tax=Portunus trituberculatus TaxID=210409 RepID=A0A5B7IKG4_PORTR|nr:hypothetical protein [Portunus trituberculatus]